MMETLCLSDRADRCESKRWAAKVVLLALLLNLENGLKVVWAAGASESNLFFSSTYGASADAKFGLKPRNLSRS
jgi:hypothetical protein